MRAGEPGCESSQIAGEGRGQSDAMTHPAIQERLERLAPDQRAAATAPPGPVLCVAPAGSGKTTTLVARIAWLIDGGADPGIDLRGHVQQARRRRAGRPAEQRRWSRSACHPTACESGRFTPSGRELLRSAGRRIEPLVDRGEVLRELFPRAGSARWRALRRWVFAAETRPGAGTRHGPRAGPSGRPGSRGAAGSFAPRVHLV